MLQELLDIFKRDYGGEEFLINNRKLKDGLYIRLKKDGNLESLLINKKTDEIREKENIDWFKKVDYYSNILPRKNLDCPSKKISTNNYLSVGIKNIDIQGNKTTFTKHLDKYYSGIKKINDGTYVEKLEEDIIYKTKEIFISSYDNIVKLISDLKLKDGDIINIFIDESFDIYEVEYKRYILPNVYGVKTETKEINNKQYGVHVMDYSLNLSKKPFNLNYGFKEEFTSLMDAEGLFDIKLLNDFMNIVRDNNISLMNDGNEIIIDYVLDNKNWKISNYNLNKKNDTIVFKIKDVFKRDESVITSLEQLEKMYNAIFFSGRMSGKYGNLNKKDMEMQFYKVSDNFTSKQKNTLLSYKDYLWSIFKLNGIYNKNNCKKILIINKTLVKDKIFNGFNGSKEQENKEIYEVKKLFNFSMSFEEYILGGSSMRRNIESFREKSLGENYRIENNDEYYYMIGQSIYYLLSQSKSSEKKLDLLKPYLMLPNNKILKAKLTTILKRYSHSVNMNSKKFGSVIKEIMIYDVNNIDTNMIIAGFLDNNLFYEKDNKDNNKEDMGYEK